MIMCSYFKKKIGDKIVTTGPKGRIGSGILPGIVLREATKEEYLELMKDFPEHIPKEKLLNKAFFYEVSVD